MSSATELLEKLHISIRNLLKILGLDLAQKFKAYLYSEYYGHGFQKLYFMNL